MSLPTAIKSFAASALLCAASVAVVCLIIEAGMRLSGASQPAEWTDRPRAYYKPEAAKYFQDFPIEPRKDGDQLFRIAVLGDSFTFATHMQFDDAFPKRLERMLNLNTVPLRAQVFNYGVPGYSTAHEIQSAKLATERDGADLMIVEITLNDPERKPFRPHGLWKGGVNPFDLSGNAPSSGVLAHSKLAQFVAARVHNSRTRNAYVDYYYDLFDNEKNWAEFTGALKAIASIGSSHNTKVVAVVFPLFGLPLDESYPFAELHKRVHEATAELGIPTLDLFSAYYGVPLERVQVVVAKDFHPNEIAHRMAAEEIYYWLAEHKFIPEPLVIHELFQDRIDIRPNSNTRLAASPSVNNSHPVDRLRGSPRR